jgi:hypothetical protein
MASFLCIIHLNFRYFGKTKKIARKNIDKLCTRYTIEIVLEQGVTCQSNTLSCENKVTQKTRRKIADEDADESKSKIRSEVKTKLW